VVVTVIELPYKLIITAIILILIVPCIWYALIAYSHYQVENNIRAECNKLITAIKHAWKGEEGTIAQVTITLQDGFFSKIAYVKVGDSLGGTYQSRIRYKIENAQELVISIIPNIPVTTIKNAPLTLGVGHYIILIEHRKLGDADFILVRFEGESSELEFTPVEVKDWLGDLYKLDLQITDTDISFEYIGGTSVKISAVVHNIGTIYAENVKVQFWAVNAGQPMQIGEELISMIPGDSATSVAIIWHNPIEGYEIWVLVDPLDEIPENDETNNDASKMYSS
jgi:hypothetical protein